MTEPVCGPGPVKDKNKLALLRNITNLFCPQIFKQNTFFHILFQNCKCIHVLLPLAKFH